MIGSVAFGADIAAARSAVAEDAAFAAIVSEADIVELTAVGPTVDVVANEWGEVVLADGPFATDEVGWRLAEKSGDTSAGEVGSDAEWPWPPEFAPPACVVEAFAEQVALRAVDLSFAYAFANDTSVNNQTAPAAGHDVGVGGTIDAFAPLPLRCRHFHAYEGGEPYQASGVSGCQSDEWVMTLVSDGGEYHEG